MTTKQEKMYYALLALTAEEAVGALLNWHGEQLLDDGFCQYLVDEGILPDDDDGGIEWHI